MKKGQETYKKTSEKEPVLLGEILAQNEMLSAENKKLTVEKENIIIEKENIAAEKDRLEIELAKLKYQVEQMKRMLFGSKRERFVSKQDANQLSLPFEIEEHKIEAAMVSNAQTLESEPKKTTRKPTGRQQLPSHLPVVETVLAPLEDVTGMVFLGNEITEELGFSPRRFFINRIIRPKYISNADENLAQKQVIAPLDRPIPKCIASPELLANMAVEKYVFHIPIYRQLLQFKQNDVHIKSSTSDSWMSLLAKHIGPLYAVHRLYTLKNSYLQVDESPIKVLDRDKPGATHQGYMWVYRAPLQNAVYFDYNRGRGQVAPQKNLAEFKGYLQTDGYVVYDQFGKKTGITQLSCWAHARRYFEKALSNDNGLASAVMLMLQELYAIERKVKEMSSTERYEIRLEESLPVLNKMGKYLAENRKFTLPSSPIGKAFEYCIARWDNLLNYLKDGNLEIDNNQIENSIRPLALGRKNYLFAGSHEAAQNIAMYYSFFGTCKKHEINPYKWLTYIIRNINDTKTSQLKYLLPQFIDKKMIE
ncbi:MAG: IS66 family transposase [Prolixibacteraceae bacterium]|nr:IS66 family transposase [Prolixibacteraceae bacterium]